MASGGRQEVGEKAWDAGWRSLCGSPTQASSSGTNQQALSFIAHTQMERGDYADALTQFRRIAAEGDAANATLANAYIAALEMRWLDAAKLYPSEPTPRHQRFWATVFYLAAQQLMFNGQADQAAEWYRRADQGYGTQGPFLGLSLVDCFVQQNRPLEAFDAYRRALVVLPAEEALAHRARFEQMRLDALRAWRQLDPANSQVAGWLDFFEGDAPVEEQRTLAIDPQPQVTLTEDLGEGRTLIGFDYRKEDIDTGPFMWVDFYVRETATEGDRIIRLRRVVLNQASNGSFAWDAAPDGARPFGWHGLVYSPNLDALYLQALFPGERWQCLDAARIGASFGLQSLPAPLDQRAHVYVQGGDAWINKDGSLSLGRTWFGLNGPYDYSYVNGGRTANTRQEMAGTWIVPAGAKSVAVWLLSHGHEQTIGCFTSLFFFDLNVLEWPS